MNAFDKVLLFLFTWTVWFPAMIAVYTLVILPATIFSSVDFLEDCFDIGIIDAFKDFFDLD